MGTFDRALAKWTRLSRLLDEAIERGPRELSAADEAIKPDLERILAHSQGSAFSGVLPAVANLVDEAACDSVQTIGPWRILRKIGEGGMATVWEAERCDGLFQRRVAIKLPRDDWAAEILKERIAREREILARLDHPNIASLLDAGMTAAGQPYLALEYVEGARIDQHCRERALPLRKRIALFLQVARAISYAHSMLVLHRDLKPSNILVGEGGEVRVLDFGIAKMLEPGETQETELTRVSGAALTLSYASPEQIRGEPLTVASDVYSLGVLLHELLTGASPYRLRRQSRAALEDAILNADEPPLSRELRGDLGTIIGKALKKQLADRYRSADAMAEDLERYLGNRPVMARPDRLSYRCEKFLRRNRVTVSVAGAAAALLLAGSATILRQARVSVVQKQHIAAARWFVAPLLQEAQANNQGKPLSAGQLLDQLERHMDRGKDADAETRLEVLNIVAASQLLLQDTARSEAAVKKAMATAANVDADHPQSLRARLLMSWVRLARGQTGELRPELGRLIADMRRSSRTLPEDLAGALRILSEMAVDEGNGEEAESSALEAVAVAEQRLGRNHNQAVLTLVDLCYAYVSNGKPALAVATGKHARGRAMEAYSQRWTHPNVLKAREAYAFALAASGDREDGLREMKEAIRDSSSSFGASSRVVGFSLRRLARVQLDAGLAADALESIDQAVSILADHQDRGAPGFARTLELRGRVSTAAQFAVVR